MDKPSGTGGMRPRTETQQLRADLHAARAELDKLTAMLREQGTSSRRSEQRLLESMEGAVIAVANAIESRDPFKAGHGTRVADLAAGIGREVGLPEERVHGIRLAASIHDIGEIHIPVEILIKPGRLTNIEMTIMVTHCQAGYEILKHLDFPWPIAQTVMQHHELLDGSGYPLKLQGGEILLESCIVTVANVVAAMTAHRAFLPATGIDVALAEIMKFRGVKFNPQVVDACVSLFREKGYGLPQD